jgi:hypothetical protein
MTQPKIFGEYFVNKNNLMVLAINEVGDLAIRDPWYPQYYRINYEIKFSIDTVMVDSKDELLFLQMNLRWSTISPDETHFYNFNYNQHVLEVIDLDKIELQSIQPFEKEGPNGKFDQGG